MFSIFLNGEWLLFVPGSLYVAGIAFSAALLGLLVGLLVPEVRKIWGFLAGFAVGSLVAACCVVVILSDWPYRRGMSADEVIWACYVSSWMLTAIALFVGSGVRALSRGKALAGDPSGQDGGS